MDSVTNVLNLVGYNIIIIELVIIAWLAYRYNGFASSGVRRYLGPFCLVLAANLVRLDAQLFEVVDDTSWAARVLSWGPLTVVMTWSVALICWFIITHMHEQLRVSRELLNRHYNGKEWD